MAVLPFTNLSGGSGNEYFSEGITDEIISQLAQVESLKVISRTSVLALKGRPLTLPQIADTLGVRHIVEGSVRRQGNRVRVTAELIEAASDAHLWSGSFEGDLADSFRVQEEIARKVSGELVSNIRGVRPMASSAMPTESAAFDALLLGRHLLERRSPEAVEGATRAFRDAIRADSDYAPAYAGLSSRLRAPRGLRLPRRREPLRRRRAGAGAGRPRGGARPGSGRGPPRPVRRAAHQPGAAR